MNHAITIKDLMIWGGFGLGALIILGVLFAILAAYGRGMSR